MNPDAEPDDLIKRLMAEQELEFPLRTSFPGAGHVKDALMTYEGRHVLVPSDLQDRYLGKHVEDDPADDLDPSDFDDPMDFLRAAMEDIPELTRSHAAAVDKLPLPGALFAVPGGEVLALSAPAILTACRPKPGGLDIVKLLALDAAPAAEPLQGNFGDRDPDAEIRAACATPSDTLEPLVESWRIEADTITLLHAQDRVADAMYGSFTKPLESGTYSVRHTRVGANHAPTAWLYRLIRS